MGVEETGEGKADETRDDQGEGERERERETWSSGEGWGGEYLFIFATCFSIGWSQYIYM